MIVERLTSGRKDDFIQYCRQHRDSLDDSFLTDEDLKSFQLTDDHPTYLLMDGDEIVGVASLMLDDYFRRGKRGRFRIFHTIIGTIEASRQLFEAILTHTEGIDRIFLFSKGENQSMRDILKKLGFEIERYSYVLDRPNKPTEKAQFPDNFELKTFQFGRDEVKWCEVRNAAFATLAGSETPLTPEDVKKMQNEEGYIEEGIKVLYCLDDPVGLLRVTKEEHKGEEHTFIHLIAVKPTYQKMGLGRNLLRAGLHFGKSQGFSKALITVNAENEKAVHLYLAEGFQQNETMICYNYWLT